jgi:hypothetical protein
MMAKATEGCQQKGSVEEFYFSTCFKLRASVKVFSCHEAPTRMNDERVKVWLGGVRQRLGRHRC